MALIYCYITPMLEATYFQTMWLLPFDILDWKTLRQMMSVHHLPLLNDEFRWALGNAVNEQTILIPPVLTFNQFFPIGHELEGGGYEEQYYTPKEYGDPLLYPDAFWEVVGEEEFSPICHMSKEEWLNWRENPMFEETWALLADFRHIVYDTEEESMDVPLGRGTALSSVASQVSRAESVMEGQTPDHFPYCAIQYEREQELQNPLVGDAGYRHWTKSMHPTKVPPKFTARVKWEDDWEEYLDNLTVSADAGHECFFNDNTIRRDIKDYKEVPLEEGEAGQTEVVAETRMIDAPDVSPHEYFMMYAQQNSPGAIPGCQSLANTDEKFSEKLI